MTKKTVYIHPKAIVEAKDIGCDTRIWAFVHILKGAHLGSNCNICDHCFIEDDVIIGNNVTVKSGVYIWNGVKIEDDVFIGPNVSFTNDIYPRSKMYQDKYVNTLIRQGASIGAGSVLIAGTVIGKYTMIGAGSVVTKNTKDYELVYGTPARHQGYICRCKEKLKFEEKKSLRCSCGLSYVLKEGDVLTV